MTIVPCVLCGYDAPAEACPHCAHEPLERSLRRPARGWFAGIGLGASAVPRGLAMLVSQRGLKRWMVPPLILTSVLLIVALWWVFSFVNGLKEANVPTRIEFADVQWAWLEGLGTGWGWIESSIVGLLVAVQWLANLVWGFLVSRPLAVLTWFLLGSLVMWYCFSIAYEALAGPFLDEVQGRIEERWFGADPRSRLQRPNDIPTSSCVRLSLLSGSLAAALVVMLWLVGPLSWWWLVPGAPLCCLPALAVDRRYGAWLWWIVRIESRALLVSLQASIITGIFVVPAMALYFVPVVGYVLFAMVCGFATAVGLLDIPLERRGWSLRQRLRFVLLKLPALIAFGVVAGMLLAVPIFGPVLMVPSASLGGLWLICRLDKGALRPTQGDLATGSPAH